MHRLHLLILLSLLTACSANTPKTEQASTQQNPTVKPTTDTTYMASGFYYPAEPGKGIRMRQEKTDSVWSISRAPFASVKNIVKAELIRQPSKDGQQTGLCLTFDGQGTKDMASGTGNAFHPKIALVLAGRLLYVAESRGKITAGVVYVDLNGYSEQEMQAMLDAVKQKR